MQDDKVDLRGVKVHPFSSFGQLLDYVTGRKGILVAINAEKILHATPQTRDIINRNIGYCDGIGAVMALRKHGYKDVVKLPGCELWLKIINSLYRDGKRFYLVGSKQEVIEATVEKLKHEYPGIRRRKTPVARRHCHTETRRGVRRNGFAKAGIADGRDV